MIFTPLFKFGSFGLNGKILFHVHGRFSFLNRFRCIARANVAWNFVCFEKETITSPVVIKLYLSFSKLFGSVFLLIDDAIRIVCKKDMHIYDSWHSKGLADRFVPSINRP